MNYISLLFFSLLPLACFSQHTISGQVVLPNASSICDVLVELRADDGQLLAQDMTGSDGVFSFENQAEGANYQVHFSKSANATAGVTTFDMLLIRQIILGQYPPDNNYFWAGDVNGNGYVSTFDLVLISKLILGVETEFGIPSWAFDEQEVYPPDNKIEISNLSEAIDLDVLGVKRGDINRTTAVCGSGE